MVYGYVRISTDKLDCGIQEVHPSYFSVYRYRLGWQLPTSTRRTFMYDGPAIPCTPSDPLFDTFLPIFQFTDIDLGGNNYLCPQGEVFIYDGPGIDDGSYTMKYPTRDSGFCGNEASQYCK